MAVCSWFRDWSSYPIRFFRRAQVDRSIFAFGSLRHRGDGYGLRNVRDQQFSQQIIGTTAAYHRPFTGLLQYQGAVYASVKSAGILMLIASKSGCISVSKLVSETDNVWTLEVENSLHRVSKKDSRQRAFNAMSDALEWAGADQEMIDHFVALEAEKSAVSNQVLG